MPKRSVKDMLKYRITIAFLLLTIALMFSWNQRNYLFDVPFDKQINSSVDFKSFIDDADVLAAELNANSILLWEINLNRNLRSVVYFKIFERGRLSELEGFSAPLFTNTVNSNLTMSKLFVGESSCSNVINSNAIGAALNKSSIINLCRTPVISKSGILVGYISYGFTRNPTDKEAAEILQKLQTFASFISASSK